MWSTICWRTTWMRSVARVGRTKRTAPTSVAVTNATKLLFVCRFIYFFLFSRRLSNFVSSSLVFIVVPLFCCFVFPFTEVLQEIRRDITRKVWIFQETADYADKTDKSPNLKPRMNTN